MKTMTEKERMHARVKIAEDALTWIEAGALIPQTMCYVVPLDIVKRNLAPREVQARDYQLGPCYVCALGALLVAKAVNYDECTIGDLFQFTSNSPQLDDFFMPEEIRAIEFAFEPSLTCGKNPWVRKYRNPEKCLKAILTNIVKHGGEFVDDPNA